MEINLLPPKSSPKLNIKRLGTIVGVTIVLGGVLGGGLYYLGLASESSRLQTELDAVQADVIVLEAGQTLSPEAVKFVDLKKEVDLIVGREHEYGQMLDSISAKLSPKAKIVAASMETELQTVKLTLHAETMDVIADYEQLLRSEPWVEDVKVHEIQNRGKSKEEQLKAELQQMGQQWQLADGTPIPEPPKVVDSSNSKDGQQQNATPTTIEEESYEDKDKKERPFEARLTITLKGPQ